MSSRIIETIEWVESHNNINFDCKLQIAKHPGNEKSIFLVIPGVDGSLDGYKDKYFKIASSVNSKHGFTSYQMDNPFISRLHWESNIRQMLDHILMEHSALKTIYIMAHSAGAWVVGNIAYEYPEIQKLLLVNPASNVDISEYVSNISRNKHSEIMFYIGTKDPFYEHKGVLAKNSIAVVEAEGVDHHFSGKYLKDFISAPNKLLF